MKRLVPCLLILATVVAVLVSKPMTPPAQARTLRLFLIGNSFSQNATTYLPQLAKEGGHELIIGRAEAPGYTMQQHWEAVAATESNPTDSKGKIYGGKTLRELLSAGTWDVVTIQQGSIASGYLDSYRPYAQKLYAFTKKLQPKAEVVIHQTWPYRSDAPDFTVIAPNTKAQSDREMWEKLLVAYHTIAAELGVRLIPVGNAFWRVASDPQWGYKKDPKFDFEKPVFPNVPDQTNSLHEGYRWQGQTKLGIDPRHANEAGKYLGGLVWYGFLFGESPEKVTFAPAGVPTAFATHLRQVAALALGMTPMNLTTRSAAATTAQGPSTPTPSTPTPSTPTPSTPAKPAAQPQPQPQPQPPSGKPGLTTAQGKGADTSVRGGSYSARGFGAHPILRVRNTPTLEHARKAYLRFDLSLLPQPVKGAKSAGLSLTVGPAEGNTPADKVWTFQVYGLKDGAKDEDWNEAMMSWGNAPANDVKTAGALTEDAIALGTFTLTGKGEAGKTVMFSSPELLKFLQSDTNGTATLIITRQEAGDSATDNVLHIFASKENEQLAAPSLNVTF